MRRLSSVTFRVRLVLIMTISQILFLGSLISAGYFYIDSTVNDQLEKRVTAFTSQFESAVMSAMISMDSGTLKSVGQHAMDLPDIVEFAIYLGDRQIVRETSTRASRDHVRRVSQKISNSGQILGRIDFAMSLAKVESSKRIALLNLITICLFELMLALFLAMWIGRYVGKRSDHLIEGIQKYAAGDAHFRYESMGDDEFGWIATSFNDMARKMNEDSKNLEMLRLQNSQNSKMAALGEMAGGVAHEINNPLAIIVARTSILQRQAKDRSLQFEKADAELSKIHDTAMRIAKIVSGLRTFSRNADNDPMEATNIEQVVEDCLTLCAERFRTSGIELRVEVEKTRGRVVLGRPTQLSQVLLNLLNNSFDAVESLGEKWICLQATFRDSTLVISVTDSGNGISAEVSPRLMEPFFTTKQAEKGTGLGLSISKNIIEGHRGRLYYDHLSKKTRFVIEIPLLAELPREAVFRLSF